MVQNVHGDDAIEMTSGQSPRQFGDWQKFNVSNHVRSFWGRCLKRHSRDCIFATRDSKKCPGESQLAATQLQDGLPRQEMDSVTEGLCSPEQPIVDYRIVFPPVLVPVSLTDCQTRDQRIVWRKQRRRRWNLQTRSGILHFKHLSSALR